MPVVRYAHRARPSIRTLRASMPRGAPRVPGQGSSSLCPSTSGVVINDGDDITSSMKVRILQADHPRRWRGPALCAPRIWSWCVSSENISNEVFFKFFKIWVRKFSCPSCSTRSARSHPPSPLEPACHVELTAFQRGSMEPVRVELWRRHQRRR